MGIAPENIRKYGLAFEGKKCLTGCRGLQEPFEQRIPFWNGSIVISNAVEMP